MARRLDDVESQRAEGQIVALGVKIRVAQLPGGDIRRQLGILLAQIDPAVQLCVQRRDAADMVKMAVGQQDGLGLQLQLLQLLQDDLRRIAGVDDDAVARRLVIDDITIGGV